MDLRDIRLDGLVVRVAHGHRISHVVLVPSVPGPLAAGGWAARPAAAVLESRPLYVIVGVVVVSAVLYVGPCADGVQPTALLPAQAWSRCPECGPWLRVCGVVHPVEEFVRSGVPGEGAVRRGGIALHRVCMYKKFDTNLSESGERVRLLFISTCKNKIQLIKDN